MTETGPSHSYQGPVALYTTPGRARAANKHAFKNVKHNARILVVDTDALTEVQCSTD